MTSGTASAVFVDRLSRAGVTLLTIGALSGLAVALTVATADSRPLVILAASSGVVCVVWLLLTARYELSLIVLLLYVGLADGYLKLSTGSPIATLGRDVVLYAIVAGATARLLVRHESVRLPPLTGWLLALVALVTVQVLNPGASNVVDAFAAVRQHIEWVPLFFAGYALLVTSNRLRIFFLLLGVVATANGIVALIQLSLTPEQLAAWGPGYSDFVLGTGDVSGRTFLDTSGVSRIRPFGLGGDVGAGGNFGLIAAPGILAVIGLVGRRKAAIPALILMAGVLLAIVTSQGRAAVLAAVITVAAFLLFGVIGRQSLRPVIALMLVVALAGVVVPRVVGSANDGTYDRYRDIAPSKAVDTAYNYRIDDIGLVPQYIRDYPLGAGLGTLGPASTLREGEQSKLSGETNFSFLIVELGIPGMVLLLAFSLRVLWLAATRIRRIPDSETRLLLAGLAAPLVGILVAWISGPALATPPYAPYFWVASGALSFWLLTPQRAQSALRSKRSSPRPT